MRATGTARASVTINGNDLTRLQQGSLVGSVLAAGFQTQDTATLTAAMTGNSEASIGSEFSRYDPLPSRRRNKINASSLAAYKED